MIFARRDNEVDHNQNQHYDVETYPIRTGAIEHYPMQPTTLAKGKRISIQPRPGRLSSSNRLSSANALSQQTAFPPATALSSRTALSPATALSQQPAFPQQPPFPKTTLSYLSSRLSEA